MRVLRRICGRQGLLPRSLQISFSYDRSATTPCRGGSADVWMGEHEGRNVAVKVLRVFPKSKCDKIARVGFRCGSLKTCIDELIMTAEVLQGGCNVETPPSPECAIAVGSDDGESPICDGIGMDDQRKHQRVHRGTSRCQPV